MAGIVSASISGTGGIETRAPVGFALRLGAPMDGEDGYRVVALDSDGSVLLSFGPFCEIDIVAVWRALAQSAGLPLLIEYGRGDLRPICDQFGPLRLGRASSRRKRTSSARRRPRFLVRRKPGLVKPARRQRGRS